MDRSYWQQGQTIPISMPDQHDAEVEANRFAIMDVLQGLQANIGSQLSSICGKLEAINGRMDSLETQQKHLEEEVRANVV